MKLKHCSILALKSADGEWIRDAAGKANVLAKSQLFAAEENEYAASGNVPVEWRADRGCVVNMQAAEKLLRGSREDWASWPDLLPTRILKDVRRYWLFLCTS